jgi:hypothetical protein
MLYAIAYGLGIQSNVAIPGLVGQQVLETTNTVLVHFGAMPEWLLGVLPHRQIWYKSQDLDEWGNPSQQIWQLEQGEYFLLRYCDNTEFLIHRSGSPIWAIWPADLTLEDTATYFLGPVLAFVLMLRGITSLHASAVDIAGHVVALVGDAGAGKSTTAATFAKMGYPVLTDDVLPLVERTGEFWVLPAYPRIRLWPRSAAALYGSTDSLPRIVPSHPTWNKCYLDLTQPGYHFQDQPLPLAAIYVLGNRDADLVDPSIDELAPQDRLMALVTNTYNHLVSRDRRAQEFILWGKLLKTVHIRQITPTADITQLPQLCEVVLNDFKNLGAQKPVSIHA